MNVQRIAALALFLCAPLSAAGSVEGPSIHVQAYVDGVSRLILDGDTVQWHHVSWAAPGRHYCDQGEPQHPTIVNGLEWFPEWPDVPTCENRDCDCDSDVFVGLEPAIPEAPIVFDLLLIQARGEVQIVEQPSAENGYRVVVEFEDYQSGPNWYELELVSVGCGEVERYCTAGINSTGVGAQLSVTGSLSIVADDCALSVEDCPTLMFGQFFMGPTAIEYPFGNGYLCISPFGPGLFRLNPPVPTSASGQAEYLLDLSSLPAERQVLAGESCYFQYIYRDVDAGGAMFNLTDAARVVFCD